MKQNESLLNVFRTLVKWKKPILWTSGAITIVAILLSLTMSNYYESTAILYPSNPDMAGRAAMFNSSDENLSLFGTQEEMNRLILVANSTEVINYVVSRYQLYDYFEIDSLKAKGPSKMRKEFMSRYNIIKNENDALEISFEDIDPELATEILWAIVGKCDEINNRLTKGNQEQLIGVYKNGIKAKQKLLVTISDSLNLLRKEYGIIDLGSQGEYLSSQIASTEANLASNRAKLALMQKTSGVKRDSLIKIRAMVRGLEKRLEALTDKDSKISIQRFNEGREMVALMESKIESIINETEFLEDRYFQLVTVYDTNISSMYLVESPSIPIEKSRPFRSIIVISALLLSLIFCSLGALLIENYREIDWQAILDAK